MKESIPLVSQPRPICDYDDDREQHDRKAQPHEENFAGESSETNAIADNWTSAELATNLLSLWHRVIPMHEHVVIFLAKHPNGVGAHDYVAHFHFRARVL